MGDVRENAQVQQHSRPPGTPVIVDVFAEPEFRHRWRFEGGSDEGDGPIKIPEKDVGQPGTPIHFHFHPGGSGLTFLQDNENVIWCDRNSCPTAGPKSDPEITNINVSPMLLRVMDLNQDECTLHYNLRFSPDPDRNFYDPEIQNGGTK